MSLANFQPDPDLLIQEQVCFQLESWCIEVQDELGQFSDVHYFKVKVHEVGQFSEETVSQTGLLRIGEIEGALSRELQLREKLEPLKMVAEILIEIVEAKVKVAPKQPPSEPLQPLLDPPDHPESSDTSFEQSEYLEDLLLPEELSEDSSSAKRIVLSFFPDHQPTLVEWFTRANSLESCVALTVQLCQLFRQAINRANLCLITVLPEFIQVAEDNFLVQFFDLTGAYPIGASLLSGLMGEYYAPELVYAPPISESMVTYVTGCLLYQSIHHRLPQLDVDTGTLQVDLHPLPIVSQILKGCFAPADDRFLLEQLMRLLIETRKRFQQSIVRWDTANASTTGLASNRLQNEDSYTVRQAILQPNAQPLMVAAIADGMGGLSQGEVASQLTVQTVVNTPLPVTLDTGEEIEHWINTVFQTANTAVINQVHDGGTTFSFVYVIGRHLWIGHVGDSRIYLLRKGQICQLSIDHSLPAMLFANGQIDVEQRDNHPDRSVLTKCLGSKRLLNPEDVQTLRSFGEDYTLLLEDDDILLLCSDGVWDVIPPDELVTLFLEYSVLQMAIDKTIEQVLDRGAPDNATLLALKCRIQPLQIL